MSNYSKLTTENPSKLKRFSHKKRFDIAISQLTIKPGHRILDYGTGDGYMLLRLFNQGNLAVGFEPDDILRRQAIVNCERVSTSIKVFSSVRELPDHSYDRICCLEVLEHLPERILIEALNQMRRLVSVDGFCIVSVPIETGLSGVFKNMVRYFLNQEHEKTTFTLLWRVLCGLKINRQSGVDYINSHIGFNHRDLINTIKNNGWDIESYKYSPLPITKSLLNSQLFIKIRPSLSTTRSDN